MIKKKKPVDATMRNVNASKKQDVSLLSKIRKLEARVKRIEAFFNETFNK